MTCEDHILRRNCFVAISSSKKLEGFVAFSLSFQLFRFYIQFLPTYIRSSSSMGLRELLGPQILVQISLSPRTSSSKVFSQRQGECYATTSMRKVELILEFNFHSGSNFLSRLVRQVISVPFVV